MMMRSLSLFLVIGANCCCGTFSFLLVNRDGFLTPKSALGMTKPAGSFFNPVPEEDGGEQQQRHSGETEKQSDPISPPERNPLSDIPANTKGSSRSRVPGMPSGVRLGKPYVGIDSDGVRGLNDVTKPEYDDQGYTLYADEKTGEKSRVFEALVDYPCDFTMKIVGANEGSFVEEMVALVAKCCRVEAHQIAHTTRAMGKWTSVTVEAPVQNAEMLYSLYEKVDRDPRVKFKF